MWGHTVILREDVPTATERCRKRARQPRRTRQALPSQTTTASRIRPLSSRMITMPIPTPTRGEAERVCCDVQAGKSSRAAENATVPELPQVSAPPCAIATASEKPSMDTGTVVVAVVAEAAGGPCLPSGSTGRKSELTSTCCPLLELGRRCAESCIRDVFESRTRRGHRGRKDEYERVSMRRGGNALKSAVRSSVRPVKTLRSMYGVLRPLQHLGSGTYASVFMAKTVASAEFPEGACVAVKQATADIDSFVDIPIGEHATRGNKRKLDQFANGNIRAFMDNFDAELSKREQRVLELASVMYEHSVVPHVPILFACMRMSVADSALPDVTDEGCPTCAVVTVMEYAELGTLKRWCECQNGRAVDPPTLEVELASLFLQTIVCACAFHYLGICHNDLYDRNVLVTEHAPGYFRYAMPGGAVLHVPCLGAIALVADWGMASGAFLGKIASGTGAGHAAPVNAAASADSGAADAVHDMSADFDVECTLCALDMVALRGVGSDPRARRAIERKSAVRACTAGKAVHVAIAKYMPAFARDVLALTSSVMLALSSTMKGGQTPWFAAVDREMQLRVVENRFTCAPDTQDFLVRITSKEFCEANRARHVYDALCVRRDDTLGSSYCIDKNGLAQQIFDFDMSGLAERSCVDELCASACGEGNMCA